MKKREYFMEKKPARAIALLPIGVFLVLYLGLGCLFEYGLKIEMGFYNIPIVVAFLAAILVACLQNRALSFDDKLEVMAKGVGDKNIMTMILIFLAAGVFVGVVGRSSAESVAYFMLAHIPARFAVAVLFIVSCFVSTAMGTSCGTITLIVPIAVAVAKASGFHLALCIGSVMGGAMFGDNLSFISDTTIAACSTQGCEMKDKFRTNFRIALPAALVALALPETDPVHKISIIPRGIGALGYTLQRPTEDRFLMTRTDLEHKIAVLLGGRAAEKLVFGELSTGAADDLARATDIARDMITRFGMDEGLGYIAFEAQRPRFLDTPELAHGGCRVAESTQARIDQAIRDIVMGVFERAYRILDINRAVLERCARELLARETLDESDIRQLTQGLVRN